MTGSDGSWHEWLHSESRPALSLDRAFGLLFGATCGVIAGFAIWHGRRSGLWWSMAASAFLVVALFASPLLGPLSRGWRWLSLQLFRILNPIIMGIVFFGVLTPAGIIMRAAGKDPLRLRFEPDRPSYWLARAAAGEQQTSMTEQF